tara:strand:- start:2989 stop:3168 length:180 start_codon:yes stop_codon:yes gene_type:complete
MKKGDLVEYYSLFSVDGALRRGIIVDKEDKDAWKVSSWKVLIDTGTTVIFFETSLKVVK